jgi:hypothetical protein
VIKRCRVLVMRDGKGMMHTAMVIGHRIDRRVTLDQNEADASRIEEHHLPVRRGGQMPTADDLRIEPRLLATSLTAMLKWATPLIATMWFSFRRWYGAPNGAVIEG